MNQKEYQMIFQIGANLASTFNTSFGSACKRLDELAKETAETSKVLKDVSGFQKAKAALEENEKKLETQREEYKKLEEQLSEMENPSEKFIEQLHKQKEKLEATETAVEKQRNKMLDYSVSLEEAGVNVWNLTEEQQRLQEQYEDFKSARERLQEVSQEYDELTNKAREQATEVGKLIGVYTAVGAAVYKSAIEPAIEFESAYAGVLKTVDGTPEQLQRIKEDILNLSANVPTTAADIAAVAEAAGQLGIAVEDITDFSSVMIDLGESTNLSANEAASDLAKFANITKMDAEYYSNLGSVIVDLGNNFATTESDIVSMATRLASTGEVTGLSEAQIMAVSTALSSVGIEAEAGGSAVSKLLKTIDSSVQTYETAMSVVDSTGYSNRELELMSSLDSKGFKEIAGSLELTTTELKNYMSSVSKLEQFSNVAGVSADQFIGDWKTDSVSALSMFIGGLNDTERTGKSAIELLNDMGLTEVRLSNAVLSLATSDGILAKATDVANTAWEENTALAVEAGKRYETTESQIQMAKNSMTNAGIALGEVFTPYVADAALGINEFAQDTAAWVRDNPETVKQVTEFVGILGGVVLSFKSLKLAGTGIHTAVTGIKKLHQEGKLASTVKWNLAAAGIAAVSTALAVSHQKYQEHLQATSDAIMYNNGATVSLSNLADAVMDYDDASYKAAQATNQQIQELEGVRDSIAEAHRELEYYKQAVDDGALSIDEAKDLKQIFEDLGNYLEQDFSGAYDSVFQNFKDAVVTLGNEAGIATGEVAKLLNSFKLDYDENITNAQQNVQEYLDKVIAGEATEDDKAQFESSQAMLYELAALDSQSKQDFDAAAAEIEGIDFGTDQQAAIDKINEITEYAKRYFEEINAAQEAIQQENDRMLAGFEVQHKYGIVSDEDFELYKGAFATASASSNMAYYKTFEDFKSQYEETVNLIKSQLDENIQEVFNQNIGNMDLWEDSLSAGWASIMSMGKLMAEGDTNIGGNWNEYYYEEQSKKTLEAAKESMSGVIGAVDEMAKTAEIAPIVIPIEIAYTAVSSGLIDNVSGIDFEGIKNSAIGHLSLLPEEIKVISAAYANGTDYSADTFLAGENGAEIITNARGYKVYTAEETKDIFDTYTQIVSILPRLQRVNAAPAVKAPELSPSAEGAPINVTLTIEQNINGSSSESLRESNEELVYKIRDVMEEIYRDNRRRAYN